jgi:glycosyltransferase involved in cell wall biosynthesis
MAFCCAGVLDGKEWNSLMRATLKKILILSDWYEPGYKAGGPIQSVKNFVVAMHGCYDISILTRDSDLGSSEPYPGIPSDQWISREPGFRIYYVGKKNLNKGSIRELIVSQKPDFIYINSMYSIPFTILPLFLLWRKKIKAIMVISPRGMLRESAIKWKSTRKKLFIALLNLAHIPENIRFHATDEQERKDILHFFPRVQQLISIPNFSAAMPESLSFIKKNPGILRCVYISRIMAIKNILFFLKMLNRVPASILLELAIYGDVEDGDYWQESLKCIQSLPDHVKVTYHGSIPNAQVLSTLESHQIFVLPTLGENFGHAIFESLSAGRPVMISNKTPWLGLWGKKAGWDLSLDDPDSWLVAIEEAADMDQSTYNEWSASSRQYAQDHQEKSNLKLEYKKLFS